MSLSGPNVFRQFQVALSFAGEDREVVERVAVALRELGTRVFYDKFEEVDLWGKDLYVHLDYVYREAADFCVVFASFHYAQKAWTTHERRSAQARAFTESREYVLPVRLDDTPIPGLLPTIGHVDIRSHSPEAIASLIAEKVGALPQSTKTAPALLDLLDLDDLSRDSILDLRTSRGGPAGTATLGVDDENIPLVLPLVDSGPMLLIGGTTRSGKSELLRSLLLSLALTHSPQELNVAIVDFKGGIDHRRFGETSHVSRSWFSPEPEDLDSIQGWLTKEADSRDAKIEAGSEVGVLVVVIDEASELLSSSEGVEFYRWLNAFMRLARHRKVCAVLASQNWSHNVEPLVNARLRISMRTTSGGESKQLLGSDVAATIDSRTPGVGWLAIGDPEEPLRFRAAYTGYDLSGTRSLLEHELAFGEGGTQFDAIVAALRAVDG